MFPDAAGSLPILRSQAVSQAERLRQTVATPAGQHELDGRGQVDAMTYRDIHRFGVPAGAQRQSQQLAVQAQLRGAARLFTHRSRLANEDRFGAADSGQFQQHAQVAGQPKAARMGAAMTIHY